MAPFRPALLVIDFQEDFCPPNGSLAVEGGRDIATTINKLLDLPFVLKVATKDWHPPSHISFASNHKDKQPFRDSINIINPANPEETYESRLWPVHCVQGTPGAELIPELAIGKVDKIMEKGQDERVEMYSPFYDPFESPQGCDSGLADLIRSYNVTDVYVVGLAADYCVFNCAKDSAKEGFKTYVVEQGTKAVDPDGWPQKRKELEDLGAEIVSMESDKVQRLMTAF
ncbi:NAD(+) salvage pathway protein [Neopestalotiopsis sp. 37M]|nr:NAD(+) salvage pathway protein [Neopestalotiopsis sp. 37M]